MIYISTLLLIFACDNNSIRTGENKQENNEEAYIDRFADIALLKYEVPSWGKLTAKQKELVYYLSEACLSGRDIIYAQNYKHNLIIRKNLEQIYQSYEGDRNTKNWKSFETLLKKIWFSNGIHHHYAEKKHKIKFDVKYFQKLIQNSPKANWITYSNQTHKEMIALLESILFDPDVASKKVVKDKGIDKIKASANNYYGENISEKEALDYYQSLKIKNDETPISYGLNSKLVKTNNGIEELTYSAQGRFGPAIQKMVFWLEKAKNVAENEGQKKYIHLLIKYLNTGDLKTWDDCNIAWVNATKGDIDFILGFIEVYGDALGYKAAYEGAVEINDFEASERMQVMSQNAQWFEDNSPIMMEHKKKNVVGVSYKVVNVAMESGDASPSTPIGINLPNANWIRAKHGSKSVSLGNIVAAYNKASGSGSIDEFYLDSTTQEGLKKYGQLAGKLHTAMHEVIGHASGKLNPGVGTPKETLKNYSNTLEEARADLVALYYIYDQKLIDLGLMPNLEVGKAEYNGYIANGLFLQLRRLEYGDNLEEDHMRNRQLVAKWCFEKGRQDNVIEQKKINGKTFFVVNDYEKLKSLFGELLREIQRIKSQGDYDGAENLVETYGVRADQELLKEAKERYEKLNLAPYSGFVQPKISPMFKDGKLEDIALEVGKETFVEQMIRYGKDYSFLSPDEN